MPPMRAACSALSALVVTVISGGAAAQLEVLEEGLAIGEWTFYPSVELRLRGEYRHPAADSGTTSDRNSGATFSR